MIIYVYTHDYYMILHVKYVSHVSDSGNLRRRKFHRAGLMLQRLTSRARVWVALRSGFGRLEKCENRLIGYNYFYKIWIGFV